MPAKVRALALAGIASFVLPSAAMAAAFGLREQSSQAQGMSFAGAAAGSGGVSSIFWNPAVVTMRPGWVAEQNVTYVGLTGTITPTVGTNPAYLPLGGSGEIGQGAVVPSAAASYQLNDRLWIGIQSGAPYGLVTDPNTVWAGQVLGRSSRIFSIAFNPVVGFKVTDWLSVGAGPVFEYFSIRLRQAVPITAPQDQPSSALKGRSWGFGFTAGATITPWAGTALGVGYRSSIHHDVVGSLTLPDIPIFAGLTGPITANLNTPEKVSFGLTQAVSPVARVNFQFEWDNWSRLGTVGVVSRQLGAVVTQLPLNFKDSFYYAVGAEYDWSPALTVRAGVGYEQGAIDFSNRGTRLPDNDRVVASIGATYQLSDRLTLNAAYSHIFLDRSQILTGPGRNYSDFVFAGYADVSADVVSVGARYVFGAPAPALVAPIVRKY